MSHPEARRPRPRHPASRAALRAPAPQGFSLVELAVSLLIGLLISLAALSTAQTFMVTQRQASAMANAEGDGDATVGALKMEAAQAGLGFFSRGSLLCPTMNLSLNGQVLALGTALMPLSLSSDAKGQMSLNVLYANNLSASSPALTSTDTAAAVGSADLASNVPVRLPVVTGKEETIVLAPPKDVNAPCTIASVTASQPGTDEQPQRLSFDPSRGKHNQYNFPDVNYPVNSRVALMGDLQWSRFRLDGSTLVFERPLTSPLQSAVVLRNVVAFRAQYGVVAPGSSSLQSWQDPSGAWATLTGAQLSQVTTVRVAVVLRSPQREKPDAQGRCALTSDLPQVFGQPLALTGDWQCYRYRVIGTTVPLRNIFYGLS